MGNHKTSFFIGKNEMLGAGLEGISETMLDDFKRIVAAKAAQYDQIYFQFMHQTRNQFWKWTCFSNYPCQRGREKFISERHRSTFRSLPGRALPFLNENGNPSVSRRSIEHADLRAARGESFKVTTISKIAELVIEDDDARGAAEVAAIIKGVAQALQPWSTITIAEATEADLITARAESPAVAAELEGLLRHLRTAPTDAPPLRVEIVNADALKPDRPEIRRIDVERDSEGKLSGAVVTDA
jgi:hypothetical protein